MPTGIYNHKPHKKETRVKISFSNKGKSHSDLTKIKMRDAKLKKPTRYWLGKKLPETMKKKISNSEKGKKISEKHRLICINNLKNYWVGCNNPSWRGGVSRLPYSVDWTSTLRIAIRERDNYICQICKNKQNDEALCVHHIDYDKNNCNPKNLISLCRKCHNKTNSGKRDYWIKYFNSYA